MRESRLDAPSADTLQRMQEITGGEVVLVVRSIAPGHQPVHGQCTANARCTVICCQGDREGSVTSLSGGGVASCKRGPDSPAIASRTPRLHDGGQRQDEGAAAAQCALGRELAAHPAREIATDGESQPCTLSRTVA